MNVLEESYRVFALFSICPTDDAANSWIKQRNILIPIYSLFYFVVMTVSSIVYIFHYLSIDLPEALYAIIGAISPFVAAYTLVTGYSIRGKIRGTFAKFQYFYAANIDQDPSEFMKEANQRGNFIVKTVMSLAVISTVMSMIGMYGGSIIYSISKCGGLDSQYIFRPFKLVFPWDRGTALSWFVEITFLSIGLVFFQILYLLFATFFISICLYHRAFSKMFQAKVDQMDGILEIKPFRLFEYKKLHGESIKFHIWCKDLFEKTAKVYSPFIFIQVIGNVIPTAVAIFQLDLILPNVELTSIVMLVVISMCGSTLLFYCYYGERASNYYETYAECLYQSNWVALPQNIQKSFIVMIIHGQKPLCYNGYEMFDISLTLFWKIMRTIVSYYLAFKTLSAKY